MADIKRVNYYRHQFLVETDFQEEQSYHVEMRHRHNRYMHGWGIAGGLLVEQHTDREVLITPGMALDRDGREVVLNDAAILAIAPLEHAGHVYVVLNYLEEEGDRREAGGVSGFARMVELPVLSVVRHHPPADGAAIALARVHLDDAGRIRDIDLSVRHSAVQHLAPGIVHTDHLADNSVTIPKLAPNLRRQHGWVRMSFKPHPLHNRTPFRIGPTEARATAEGSWGTMGVPAPPGANWCTGFRIAGEWNDGEITLELYKTGWNPDRKAHEKETILTDKLKAGPYRDGEERKINPFEVPYDLDHQLDRGHHGLAVVVGCTAEASISLIAVRFEYDFRDFERRSLGRTRR